METEFTLLDPNQGSKQSHRRKKMYLTIRLYLTLIHRTMLLGGVLIVGAFLFQAIEKNHHRYKELDMKESVFFCYTVVTTVGIGRITPQSNLGKVFTIVYAFIGIPVMLFALGAYATFANHCIRKMIIGFEFCCCMCWRGKYMHLKTLIILLVLLVVEIFCFAIYIRWLHAYTYLDYPYLGYTYFESVYALVITITTVGFGDINAYPSEDSPGNAFGIAFGYYCIHLLCSITIVAIYQAVQGMIQSVNNNRRGLCAIFFCCYSNDRKDRKDTRKRYPSPH